MSNQNPQDGLSDTSTGSEFGGNIKALMIGVGGVALILSILVLLPMLLTYLSEGDVRAPASTTERYSDVGANLSQGNDSAQKASGQLNNVFK
jgi:hypothetical protein